MRRKSAGAPSGFGAFWDGADSTAGDSQAIRNTTERQARKEIALKSLEIIKEHGGVMRLKDLARILKMKLGGLSALLSQHKRTVVMDEDREHVAAHPDISRFWTLPNGAKK